MVNVVVAVEGAGKSAAGKDEKKELCGSCDGGILCLGFKTFFRLDVSRRGQREFHTNRFSANWPTDGNT